ncbi:hypothetical protein PIB30_090420 [Stylosanthes scabra]|uniref:CCHC-type domain-containing protein n=1 Tax=Stylosanthes scabra TaxID=79078 RepID=A0ABU6UUZ7_9FABA|nr:hypothetical protein [Stylosanthes scabra]
MLRREMMLVRGGFLLRHRALHDAAQWLLFVGTKRQDLFKEALMGIKALCRKLECESGATNNGPVMPGVVMRCGSCNKTGHTKRRCGAKMKKNAEPDGAAKGLEEMREGGCKAGGNDVGLEESQPGILGTVQSQNRASFPNPNEGDWEAHV